MPYQSLVPFCLRPPLCSQAELHVQLASRMLLCVSGTDEVLFFRRMVTTELLNSWNTRHGSCSDGVPGSQPCLCWRGPNPRMAELPQWSYFCRCPDSSKVLIPGTRQVPFAQENGVQGRYRHSWASYHRPRASSFNDCPHPAALKSRFSWPLTSTLRPAHGGFSFSHLNGFLKDAWLPGLRGHPSPHEHYCLHPRLSGNDPDDP